MGSATTKHDLIKRVAAETQQPRNVVRQIVQQLLDDVIDELANGNRLEFRDFGVFEVVPRRPRVARNPRTGQAIHVPAKSVVHFKQGRIMKLRVAELAPDAAGSDTVNGKLDSVSSGGESVAPPDPAPRDDGGEPPRPML